MLDGVGRQARRRRSGARSRPTASCTTVRLTLRIGSATSTGCALLERGLQRSMSSLSSALSRPWSCVVDAARSRRSAGTSGLCRICGEVEALAPSSGRWRRATSSRSTRPTISSTVRKPSSAMISRSSSATNIMKLTTCSGLPSNFLRSSGSCVAMPTGQVLRWQTRIMMQPDATSADGGEAELLGAEQRGDRDVAAGLELAVGLDPDAAAQVVHHQHLLRLGEAELPRDAGVLDRGERRGAGAAVVAADQHDVGLGLGRRRRRPCRRRPRRPASR